MKTLRDIIVIGAGPAGLSAAVTASEYGLDVLVLDEQPSLGGQIYRNIERASDAAIALLGSDYSQGLSLIERFRNTSADFLGNAIVWCVDPKGSICFSRHGKSREILAKHVLIATGAMERPVPFPGWTLPGVMGVGAVDANFKSSRTIPKGPVAMAGSGPLLLSTACHLLDSGVTLTAVLDTTPLKNILSCIPFFPQALRRPGYLLKGLGMLVKLQRANIRYVHGVSGFSAHGGDRLGHVSFQTDRGIETVDANVLLVHEGIMPRCDLTRQIGMAHLWNPVQRYWYPKTTVFGGTQMTSIHVAGDGAFVHGGISAELKGSLAALDITASLKSLPDRKKNALARKIKLQLFREHSSRPFVDALYSPRPNLYDIPPDTMICRCEALTVGDIRKAIFEGCREPNEIKAMTRCGMGPCQARMCGNALAEITAGLLGIEPLNLTSLTIRPPVRNISLSELAGLIFQEEKADATG